MGIGRVHWSIYVPRDVRGGRKIRRDPVARLSHVLSTERQHGKTYINIYIRCYVTGEPATLRALRLSKLVIIGRFNWCIVVPKNVRGERERKTRRDPVERLSHVLS